MLWMLWMLKKAGKEHSNNKTYQFWRQDNRPIEITSSKFYNQKMEYIHYIPVKEGFKKKLLIIRIVVQVGIRINLG